MELEENRIFPDNWKEVVRGKVVILYNTGVSSLMHLKEKQVEEMKWVFRVFQEHPEVVLWWRPHPLELSTLQSMLPALEEQYRELRQQYMEENIGILDESVDLNRAIAISDAYYGAWSSVAELYKAVKKPVLYENFKVTSVKDVSFLPVTLCVKENEIWFIQLDSNKLVMVDRDTYEVRKMISLPSEPPFRSRLYNYHIIDVGNSLLLLLGKSNQIYEYEMETDIIKVHKPQLENFVFHSEVIIEKNGKLLMFPYDDSYILEYDYRTDAVDKRQLDRIRAAKCYESIGEKVYLVDGKSNALYQYDLTDDSCSTVFVGEKDNKYWGVKKTGRYWVLPHIDKQKITLWNERNGELAELTEFPERYACLEKFAYLDMFEKNGYIYIFPFYANMILEVDVENKVVNQAFPDIFFDTRYDFSSEEINYGMYLCARRYHNRVYAYATYKSCWQIFDLENMEVQESPVFEIQKTEHKNLLECILDDEVYDESFCEGERTSICSLQNYISNLLGSNRRDVWRDANKGSIGTAIYNLLAEE